LPVLSQHNEHLWENRKVSNCGAKNQEEEKTGDVNVAIEKASQRDKTRVRPQDLCKRIDSQGERAKNIVQGCDLLNSGEREEICRIIKDVQDTSKNDLSLINRSTDFIFLQQREQAIQRITDNYLEIKQILKIAQKRDNSQALRDYLHEAMKRRVEEDFARLVGSSVSERAATDDKKIGDGLQITIHDKSKIKIIKDVKKSTGEFSAAYRKLMYGNWHSWYEIVKDYSDCQREFAQNEMELTIERVDNMRTRIMKACVRLNTWMSHEQFLQRTLQEFVNQQAEFANQQLVILDKAIGKAYVAKEQIASGYLTALIETMESARESIKNEVAGLENDISAIFNDILSADFKQLKATLRDFLWNQLDPKRAKQGAELFRKSYEQGNLEWREHLRSKNYGKEMQMMFIGQRAMTYHETRLIKASGGDYFFTSDRTSIVGRAYSFVPGTAQMVIDAYSSYYPDYNSAGSISSYLQDLSAQWAHYAFGWDNTPAAQRSYGQQGLLYMYPYGAVKTFIDHVPAWSRDFAGKLASDPTLQEREKKLIQNFVGITEEPLEGTTREEEVQILNAEREVHQEEIGTLVANKLPHLSEKDQKYIREMKICYRSYDVEYRFMSSDYETIEEEQHVQEMIEISGINKFLANKYSKVTRSGGDSPIV
jgi:hypothetical protein